MTFINRRLKSPGLFSLMVTVIFFLPINNTLADRIILLDGISAEADIIDTSGCSVTIKKNGHTVTIKKSNIDQVIWKADTLSFKGYTCPDPEAPKRVVNASETPEFKLAAFFDNAPIEDRRLKLPAKMAFLVVPLESNTDVREFIGVVSPLFDSLSEKIKVEKISSPALYDEIASSNPGFDYVFIPRMFIEEIRAPSKNFLSNPAFPAKSSPFSLSPQQKKSILLTSAIFMIFDCNLKKVVFRKEYKEKRTVWGENNQSLVNALTPDSWEREWENRQKQRKLSKNVQSMKNKVAGDLGSYLAQ